MSFSLDYDSQPKKFLKKQEKHLTIRLVSKIKETLPKNPVPHDAVSIKGKHNCFRIRIGDYRVLYRINYQLLLLIKSGVVIKYVILLYNASMKFYFFVKIFGNGWTQNS